MMTVIHLCLFVCMFVPVCLCACLYEMVTLMMPALSGGGGRCRAPPIWDCSNINVSGAPPRLFKYQRPPITLFWGVNAGVYRLLSPLSIPNTPFTSQSTPILTSPITLCGPSSIPPPNTSTSQTTHAISPRSLATSAPTTLTSHIHTSPIVSSSTVPIINPSSTKSLTCPSSTIPSTTQIHHHSPSTTSSNLFFPSSPNPANISPSLQSPSSCQLPSSSPPPTPAKTRLATLKSLTIPDKHQNGL